MPKNQSSAAKRARAAARAGVKYTDALAAESDRAIAPAPTESFGGSGWQRLPNTTAEQPAWFHPENDVNPVCGHHMGEKCDGCGVCTMCDGCYCAEFRDEAEQEREQRRAREIHWGHRQPDPDCYICTYEIEQEEKARRRAAEQQAAAEALAAAHAAAAEMRPLVVDALTELLLRRGGYPVTVIEPETAPQPPSRHAMYPDREFGTVEPAVDGYVVRKHSKPHRYAQDVNELPRVPVPYRTACGKVKLAELPSLAWRGEDTGGQWVFAHNGWAVAAPGQPADPPVAAGSLSPSPELLFQVQTFHMTGSGSEGLNPAGGDYTGNLAYWSTGGWFATKARAREFADAVVAWAGRTLRAQVWQHAPTLEVVPHIAYQVDAAHNRPAVPRRPFRAPVENRPADPAEELIAEPEWRPTAENEGRRFNYGLHVWTPRGWETFGWFYGRTETSCAGVALRIGVEGGPYPFGFVSGPHHPRAWAHDWTQEGRSCADRIPDRGVNEPWQ